MYDESSDTRAIGLVGSLFATIIAVLAYKSILDFAYIYAVFPNYAYQGYIADYSVSKTILADLAIILVTVILKLSSTRHRPSDIVINFQWLVVLVPLLTLYGQEDRPTTFVFAAILAFLLLAMTTRIGRLFSVKQPGSGFRIIGLSIGITIACWVYGLLIMRKGLGGLNFDLHQVYQQRDELTSAGLGDLFWYLISWQGYVVNIVFVVWALSRRRYVMAFSGFAAQVLLFGLANYKAFLLAPFIAVIIYFLPKKQQLMLLVCGAMVLLLAGIVAQIVGGENIVTAIFVNRAFFVPAMLHYTWYDFFTDHPHVLLSNSVLSWIFSYPYNDQLMHVVSQYYWGQDFSPNVGYLGDAYAQFGVAGMFVFSLILGLLLKLVDSVGKEDVSLSQAVIVIPGLALLNSALFTTLLTHGFIISILFLWIIAWQGNKSGAAAGQ